MRTIAQIFSLFCALSCLAAGPGTFTGTNFNGDGTFDNTPIVVSNNLGLVNQDAGLLTGWKQTFKVTNGIYSIPLMQGNYTFFFNHWSAIATIPDTSATLPLQPLLTNIATITTTNLSFAARIDSLDNLPGFLMQKILHGANITFTTNNIGGNETVTISGSASGGGGSFDPFSFTTNGIGQVVASGVSNNLYALSQAMTNALSLNLYQTTTAAQAMTNLLSLSSYFNLNGVTAAIGSNLTQMEKFNTPSSNSIAAVIGAYSTVAGWVTSVLTNGLVASNNIDSTLVYNQSTKALGVSSATLPTNNIIDSGSGVTDQPLVLGPSNHVVGSNAISVSQLVGTGTGSLTFTGTGTGGIVFAPNGAGQITNLAGTYIAGNLNASNLTAGVNMVQLFGTNQGVTQIVGSNYYEWQTNVTFVAGNGTSYFFGTNVYPQTNTGNLSGTIEAYAADLVSPSYSKALWHGVISFTNGWFPLMANMAAIDNTHGTLGSWALTGYSNSTATLSNGWYVTFSGNGHLTQVNVRYRLWEAGTNEVVTPGYPQQ